MSSPERTGTVMSVRSRMAKVLIKADDFRADDNDRWARFLEWCVSRQLPVAIGFIGSDVDRSGAADETALRLAGGPGIEVWNHGYGHERGADGSSDFYGRSVDQQRSDMERTQALALELFGYHPNLFGPPFNRFDLNTLRAIKQIGCFSHSFDIGYLAGVTSFPRALYVECEGPANGRRFGLDRALERSESFMRRGASFVLQIHPGNHWEPQCLENLEQYVQTVGARGYSFCDVESFR